MATARVPLITTGEWIPICGTLVDELNFLLYIMLGWKRVKASTRMATGRRGLQRPSINRMTLLTMAADLSAVLATSSTLQGHPTRSIWKQYTTELSNF
jgi:hypothetical protein